MALQRLPEATPKDFDADPNTVVQKDDAEQDFKFINLRELINTQQSRAVQELCSSFSVVLNTATSYESQAAQLIDENRRLRQRLGIASKLQNASTDLTADTTEWIANSGAPDACGPLFAKAAPVQKEVLQSAFTLGSAPQDHRPPPNVEACSPSDPIPMLNLGTPMNEKNAWTHGIGNANSNAQVADKLNATFESVVPAAAPESTTSQATMVTDFALEDVQDTPRILSLEAKVAKEKIKPTAVTEHHAPVSLEHQWSEVQPERKTLDSAPSLEARRFADHQDPSRAMPNSSSFKTKPTEAWRVIPGLTDPSEELCRSCGTPLTADAVFCQKCGRRKDGPIEVGRHAGSVEVVSGSDTTIVLTAPPKENDVNEHGQMDIHGVLHESPSMLKQRKHNSEHGTESTGGADWARMGPALGGSTSSRRNSQDSHGDGPDMNRYSSHLHPPATKPKHTFEVLPIWRSSGKYAAQSRQLWKSGDWHVNGDVNRTVAERPQKTQNDGGTLMEQRDFRDSATEWCHIINPNDPRRGLWDTTSLFLVLYDMGAIPFEFFDPPTTPFSFFMTWTTRIFWTIDMPMSFLTGYVTSEGFIELRPHKIARRYVCSWFSLDIVIVLVDWLELLMSANSNLGFARMGKASRTFRIVRMLRLLRLARMKEVLALITERINSEKVVIVADIMKTMTIILGLAHLIACLWYAVGSASDPGDSWIDKAGYIRRPIADRYAIALHWSIAQFAGGMDEVTPNNPSERCFAIGMFILAFIVASVFVSSITSSMTQLNIIGSQQSQQVSTLRRYLYQNGITNKLAVRIQRNAQHTLKEQLRSLPESSVQLLNVVSEPLRVEIHLEMYAPALKVHPFFNQYIEECPQVMRKVCHAATCMMMVSASDVVFCAGEIPSQPKMYIIVSGQLEYDHGLDDESILIGEHQWVSEQVLWVEWMHRGSLMAVSDCRLCVLDAKKFQHICGEFSHGNFDPQSYATDFVKILNQDGAEPSDLPFDFDPESSNSVAAVRLSLLRTQTCDTKRDLVSMIKKQFKTYIKKLRKAVEKLLGNVNPERTGKRMTQA